MFLRCKTRKKDGKTHRYWIVVENCRRKGGGIVQRQLKLQLPKQPSPKMTLSLPVKQLSPTVV
jgi:hypothetical protein